MSLVPYVIESDQQGRAFLRYLFQTVKGEDHLPGRRGQRCDPPAWWWPSFCFWSPRIPNKDINLYINSPGGSVTAGMAIYDTMNYIKCDVSTICIGMAASMGAFLLSGGAKGKRFALPNAEIMIHQPSGGAQGQATEIKIVAENILKTKKKLNEILAANTGQPLEVIERDTERDNYMSAEEAKDYGLIDAIIVTTSIKPE